MISQAFGPQLPKTQQTINAKKCDCTQNLGLVLFQCQELWTDSDENKQPDTYDFPP